MRTFVFGDNVSTFAAELNQTAMHSACIEEYNLI